MTNPQHIFEVVVSTWTQRGEVDSTRLAGRESGLTTDDTAGVERDQMVTLTPGLKRHVTLCGRHPPSTNEIPLPAARSQPTNCRNCFESHRSRLAARHPDRLGPNSRPVTHRKSTSARGHDSSRHPDILGHNTIVFSQNNQTDHA